MAARKLIFATGNPHKIREIEQMLDGQFSIVGLEEAGIDEEIPETRDTIADNAIQKAEYVFEHLGKDCFAEDTGLEIDSLGGAPGVHTARYAGDARDPQANMARVLAEMEGAEERDARFRTVIALFLDGQLHTFEGIVEGRIAMATSGKEGFGYDPIFKPEGNTLTFAEMDATSKNKISHRGRAVAKLIAFLQSNV